MSTVYSYDLGATFCCCMECAARAGNGLSVADGGYYVPDPPKIPGAPKIPTGPTIPDAPKFPDPPTIPDAPRVPGPPGTTPGDAGGGGASDVPGYTGPRFHTLLRGDSWNAGQFGTPVVVPFSFATRSLSNYAEPGFPGQAGFDLSTSEPLDPTQCASIRQALTTWEQASGIIFVEVPDAAEWSFGGVRFMIEDLSFFGVPGLGGISVPSDPYTFNVALDRAFFGDASLSSGTLGFMVTLHEVGHAIGLKHPFMGSPVLSTAEDNTNNTVMSYNDKGNYTGLGPFDVDAVRYLYGSAEAAASAPVHWAHGPNGSLISIGNDADNLITGLVIRDIVYANGGDDRIEAFGGDDEITPGAGNDAVFGGGGVDILHTGVLRLQAEVALGRNQGTVAMPDGTDSFYDVEILRFLDGDLHLDAGGAAGQAYRLYGAMLGRAPDSVGLSHWATALQSGAITLSDAAASFAHSAEFAARYGAPSDAGFVSLLYANVLGRAPDTAGMGFWTDAVQGGGGRAGALLGFAQSAEYQQKTADALSRGLWVADPEAVDVLRAYLGVLDRLPDAGGLAHWAAARNAGFGQADLVDAFVDSGEFQDRFGGLSNRGFVEQLYRTSLDREADAAGLESWTRVLDAGIDTRAGVAFGFAGSAEMTVKLTPMVEDGILFA